MLKWPIPLTVDVKYGDSWRVKKKFFEEFPHTKKRLNEPLMEFQPGDVSKSVESTPAPTVDLELPILSEPDPVTTPVKNTVDDIPATTPAPTSETESIEDLLAGFVIPVENKQPPVTEILPEPKLATPVSSQTPAVVPELSLVEPSQTESGFGKEYLVYTLNNLKDSTRRHLNEILIFLRKENERSNGKYQSDKKILRLRAPGGDILNVEDMKVNADVFLGLARYFEL
jgi:hypothetical protein